MSVSDDSITLKGGSCIVQPFVGTSNPHRLFIGGFVTIQSKANLQSAGITHILSAAKEWPPGFPEEFHYFHVEMYDETHWNILSCLPRVLPWIDSVIGDGTGDAHRLLIHCSAGMSRSGALGVAYIMHSKKCSFDEALQLARQSREIITPNKGFEEQLRYWHTECALQLEPLISPSPALIEFLVDYRKIPTCTVNK